MSFLTKVIGPKSKYDKTIPFTYSAKIYILENDEDLCRFYYGDTICSLVEHLDKNDISPNEVILYGIYKKNQIELKKDVCLDESGNWLHCPELCRSLETHYQETSEKIYKGHVEIGECCYEDRDQTII